MRPGRHEPSQLGTHPGVPALLFCVQQPSPAAQPAALLHRCISARPPRALRLAAPPCRTTLPHRHAAPPRRTAPFCRYWFLTDVYPLASGRHIVRTPAWLSRLCLQYGIGRVPIQAVNLVNPSDVGFRAFSGRGRRLGD